MQIHDYIHLYMGSSCGWYYFCLAYGLLPGHEPYGYRRRSFVCILEYFLLRVDNQSRAHTDDHNRVSPPEAAAEVKE